MVGISPRGESLFPVTCCRFGHNGSLTEALKAESSRVPGSRALATGTAVAKPPTTSMLTLQPQAYATGTVGSLCDRKVKPEREGVREGGWGPTGPWGLTPKNPLHVPWVLRPTFTLYTFTATLRSAHAVRSFSDWRFTYLGRGREKPPTLTARGVHSVSGTEP